MIVAHVDDKVITACRKDLDPGRRDQTIGIYVLSAYCENGGQDECGAWICREYPAILYVRSNYVTKAYGGPPRKMGPHVWKPFTHIAEGQHAWAKEHIQTKHGALGAVYPDRAVGAVDSPVKDCRIHPLIIGA